MSRHAIIGLVLASLAFAERGTAQQLDRTKQPVAEAPTPFVFPKMETQKLANGLLVVVIENHSLPLVAVRAVVAVDSLNDPRGKEGLFALTSQGAWVLTAPDGGRAKLAEPKTARRRA